MTFWTSVTTIGNSGADGSPRASAHPRHARSASIASPAETRRPKPNERQTRCPFSVATRLAWALTANGANSTCCCRDWLPMNTPADSGLSVYIVEDDMNRGSRELELPTDADALWQSAYAELSAGV